MSGWRLASYAVAFLAGLGVGMALTAWLVSASAHAGAGAPKYRLGMGSGLPPAVRQARYTTERLWDIQCVGSAKDCGPTPIPEPGSLTLVGIGLALLVGAKSWR